MRLAFGQLRQYTLRERFVAPSRVLLLQKPFYTLFVSIRHIRFFLESQLTSVVPGLRAT